MDDVVRAFQVQNLTGQKIFLLIKAQNNGPLVFEIYSRSLALCPQGTALCKLQHGECVKLPNRNYSTYEIHDLSKRNLQASEEQENGETVIIIEKNPN